MSEELIVVRRELPLGWVIVNRPAQRNALNAAMWQALGEAVHALAQDDGVRVIIVTGAGEQAFIAGADIAELKAQTANAELIETNIRESLTGLNAITAATRPVIAMINGACFGGGVLVAATCDLRFASATAQFGIPAGKLGLAYPFEEGVLRLVNLIGPANAADVLLSGRAFDADEARQMGLINRVLPAAGLEAHTREYALRLAETAPLSLAAHKLAIQQAQLAADERDRAACLAAIKRCYESADHREGLEAFLAKRPPRFQGR
ncbi:MAG: enoyl-CoA hydratase/isomerase family protein [Acidobacteria bacterium]|nr:enoyl-CoA hydratase/isomerase family protein [Acidobacteriota bacterium]MBI3421460.1 enoyl-CoA hydratase/isomerase family protein [Acidobacteriota bacterium]